MLIEFWVQVVVDGAALPEQFIIPVNSQKCVRQTPAFVPAVATTLSRLYVGGNKSEIIYMIRCARCVYVPRNRREGGLMLRVETAREQKRPEA